MNERIQSFEEWAFRVFTEEVSALRREFGESLRAFASLQESIREAAHRDLEAERRAREADLRRPRKSEARARWRVSSGAQDWDPRRG